MIKRFLAVVQAFATRWLRHDDLLAQLQAWNDESALSGQEQSGLLRLAPAFEDRLAHRRRQAVEPGLVMGERQARGAIPAH
ncbi:hypothetical protein D3C77_691060 [compost metagenome]